MDLNLKQRPFKINLYIVIRLIQVVLNFGGVIPIFIMIVDMKNGTTWLILAWFGLMIFELFLSASGVVLYLMAKYCSDETVWRFLSGAYCIIQSHIILFALLLGCQESVWEYFNPVKDVPKYVPAGVAGTIICEISSIFHFICAFFPAPIPLTGDGGLNDKAKEIEYHTTDQLVLSSADVSGLNSITDTVDTVQSDSQPLPKQAPSFS